MRRILNYFLRGLLVVVPLAVTVYVAVAIFTTIDGWLSRWIPLPVPGAGFALTIILITVVGVLASSFLTRRFVAVFEEMLNRLPLVRLLYSSTRDLLDAFVGEKRRFDRPVLVRLVANGTASALGFVTQESLDALGLPGEVAVYLPQSYGWAGNLLVFPKEQVRAVDADSADVMAFIISGGVTVLGPRAAAVSAEAAAGPGTAGAPRAGA